MKKNVFTSAIAVLLGMVSVGTANANSFSMSIVTDNDYAVFSGTSTGINHLLYQNDVSWYTQVPMLSTLTFSMPTADTMFYVLAMGGGGQENISGTVNGVNMTDPSVSVSMSSDIRSYLTGFNAYGVTWGFYNAVLADVQAAFSAAGTTWSTPIPTSSGIVIGAAGFGSGYAFPELSAHLFAFNSASVGVQAVPEPTSIALLGMGLLGFAATRRKKNQVL